MNEKFSTIAQSGRSVDRRLNVMNLLKTFELFLSLYFKSFNFIIMHTCSFNCFLNIARDGTSFSYTCYMFLY